MWQWGAESTSRCWWLWWRLDMGKLYIHLDAKQLMFTCLTRGWWSQVSASIEASQEMCCATFELQPCKNWPYGDHERFCLWLCGGAERWSCKLKGNWKRTRLGFFAVLSAEFWDMTLLPELCKISLNSCGAIESKLRADAKMGTLLVLYIFLMGKPEITRGAEKQSTTTDQILAVSYHVFFKIAVVNISLPKIDDLDQ